MWAEVCGGTMRQSPAVPAIVTSSSSSSSSSASAAAAAAAASVGPCISAGWSLHSSALFLLSGAIRQNGDWLLSGNQITLRRRRHSRQPFMNGASWLRLTDNPTRLVSTRLTTANWPIAWHQARRQRHRRWRIFDWKRKRVIMWEIVYTMDYGVTVTAWLVGLDQRSCSTLGPVTTCMADCLLIGKPSRYV